MSRQPFRLVPVDHRGRYGRSSVHSVLLLFVICSQLLLVPRDVRGEMARRWSDIADDGFFVHGATVRSLTAEETGAGDGDAEVPAWKGFGDSPHPIIARITTQLDTVYPPEENRIPALLYRMINALHFRTHPDIVRRELLFRLGEPLSEASIAETERNLRLLRGFRKVAISSRIEDDGTASVDVHTFDAWTTKLIVDISRQGGDLRGELGIAEDNLFGRGKRISCYYADDAVRETLNVRYDDPRVLGKFITASVSYQKADDLESYGFFLGKPFVSLLTPWALDFYSQSQRYISHHYEEGDEILAFTREREDVSLGYGVSPHPSADGIFRYRIGFRYSRERFSTADDERGRPWVLSDDFSDRLFAGAFFGLEISRTSFIKEYNINKYGRDEDFDLGPRCSLELALYPEIAGSHENNAVPSLACFTGKAFGPGHFLTITGRGSLRWNGGTTRNLTGVFVQEYVYRVFQRLTVTERLHVQWQEKQDADRQIILGGEEGLEAYKSNYLSGNKAMLLRIQARILLVDDLLKILTIGGLVFADAGNAWPEEDPMDLRLLKADAGLGLRLTLPRSSTGSSLKITYAYAFHENGLDNRWLFSFQTTTGF